MVFNKGRNLSLNERIESFAAKLADLREKHAALGVDSPHIAEKIEKLAEGFEALRAEAVAAEREKVNLLAAATACGVNPLDLIEGRVAGDEIYDDLEFR